MDNKINYIKTASHYDVIAFENSKGRPCARVINKNAKKLYNQIVCSFYFVSIEQRDAWIDKKIESLNAWEVRKLERKEQRKLERKTLIENLKVGDILTDSWGYDQTNVEFYKVLSIKGSTVEIRELTHKVVEGSYYSHGMACQMMPGDSFVKDSEVIKKQVRSPYIKIGSCISLSKWDGQSKYCSWYA